MKTQRISGIITGLSLLTMTVISIWAMSSIGSLQEATTTQRFSILMELSPDTLNSVITGWNAIAVLDVIVSIALIVYYHKTNSLRSVLSGTIRLVYTGFLVVATSSLSMAFGQFNVDMNMGEFEVISQYISEFYSLWNIGLIVFGLHLVLWARLASKVGWPRRILKVLLYLGGVGYVLTSGGPYAFEQYAEYSSTVLAIFMLPMVVGEVGMGISLMVKEKSNPH